jgi:hypothetical protein
MKRNTYEKSNFFTSTGYSVKPAAPEAAVAPAAAPAAEVKAVSDGSEDLIIDYQTNLVADDAASHFNWKGNIRYMAAEDSFDAVTGASALGSTHLFQAYLYDVEGNPTMSTGLRGLFLYGVNGLDATQNDNLNASKAADGTIVIQYVHRGTAYRFTTDSKGILALPDGSFESRKIGTPDGIEAAFTSDGKASGVDFAKVWSSDVMFAGASDKAMYVFDGPLQVTLENDILAIKGTLTAVKQ